MSPGRRETLILAGVAAGATALGGIAGVMALQSRSGAAELLASSFPDRSGERRRLLEWQGRVLVCNFWATWCAPCREEMPLLDALQAQHASSGVQVVGIALDNAANVGEFLRSRPVTYPLLIADATGIELMRRLGNSGGGLPFTVVLDRRGRLAERKLGPYSAEDLQKAVAGLLQ